MRRAAALLWVWGVTVWVLPDAKAASLSLTPNHHLQALRGMTYDFYQHDGRWCKKCPPGTYVSAHCTRSEAEGTCLPCPDDTFFQHKNEHSSCSSCKTCRLLDEVERKPCTKTNNTQCACKTGSYCSPGLPCETCLKCSPRCPDGEVMVHPCTPESDIQCEKPSTVTPPTSPTPAAGSSGYSIWIYPGIIMIVAVCILAVYLCVKRRRESRVTVCSSGTLQRLRRKFILQSSGDPESQNEQVDQRSPNTEEASTMMSLLEKETERRLVPQNGKDPTDALRLSFEIFSKVVPLNSWKRFMRALGLTDNDIDIAEADEKCVNDQHFLMLRTWQTKKGKEATLDTLLDTLCAIELRGVMKTVRDELISKSLYCYEE
ncbi:tumor necrosis factor receptor superfamily member 10A-like [Tiliqua scincoides]|uniref:tumor necrosis factor receptor superfamily member 10A-like n=1 Tax=Tiliqua scincoides TaxID=71010 RepID=UPI003462B270